MLQHQYFLQRLILFTTANMICYNWNNITFIYIYYWHYFYYTPIIASHINHYEKCYVTLFTREIEGIDDTILFKR